MPSRSLTWTLLVLSAVILMTASGLQVQGASLGSLPEKEKLKQELVKEMAEYLYSVMQREQQQQTGFDDGSLFGQRRNPLYPVSGFDFSTLGPMRQVNPVEPANVRPVDTSDSLDTNVKYFIKKSMQQDNKQIRFHQCYFNPISCFRK